LTTVQSHQDINLRGVGEADVIAAHQVGGHTCVQVFFFRAGCNYGNRAYYPDHGRDDPVDVVLEAFIGQFYASHRPPPLILLSGKLPHQRLVEEALGVRAERKVRVVAPQRGEKRNLVEHALTNAREALSRRMAESTLQHRLLEGLAQSLDLDGPPERIEVYDNSHVSGSEAVGAMIAAGPDGFIKSGYRKFNMRGGLSTASAGDDYAMMREMLTRRFSRALKEDPDRAHSQWPQLVIIDGGAGHLGIARQVFEDLGIDDIAVAAIAKGPDRNAGRERIFLPGRQPVSLDSRDPVLYFLQRLRDEAHRFAIGSHRAKRSKKLKRSPLDEIPGIGARRKKSLLHHFGSVRSIEQAGRADLAAAEGISQSMANKIYEWFHPER
jgi:excinuclease ABC subunit C